MTELSPGPSVLSSVRAERRPALPSRREVLGAVARLDPDLDPESTTFRSAAVLLAGCRIGQNVDRVARFTGYPREFVARIARRLYDNGVWKDGQTCCAWSADVDDPSAFWADVGVAEGRLCRRLGESGCLQWAAAGRWRKRYDFVDEGAQADTGVRYLAPAAAPEPAAFDEPDPTPGPFEPSPPSSGYGAPGEAGEPERTPDEELTVQWLGRDAPAPRRAGLFPDAVWLT